MSKFEIGDRVKCVEEDVPGRGDLGGVYKVVGYCNFKGIQHLALDGLMDTKLRSDRFELYAKAGEFAAGDWLVAKEGDKVLELNLLEPGKAYKAELAYRLGDCLYVDFGEANNSHFQSRFRLATPEEIAAPESAPTPLARELVQKLRDNDAKTAKEIPASEFDFSTIKAGDEIIVRLVVDQDGTDSDGEISFPRGYIEPPQVVSVIPAPKPKTLRERAIEAVLGLEWSGDSLTLAAATKVVDLVLAEVERGEP